MISDWHSAGSSAISVALGGILTELHLLERAREVVRYSLSGPSNRRHQSLIQIASGCFHLHSGELLFNQLIGMSGTSLLRARVPELLEKSFARIADILEIQHLSPAEQVREIVQVPMRELTTKIGRQIPLGPMVDGDFIPEITSFKSLTNDAEVVRLFPGIFHCKRVIMGDSKMDVSYPDGLSVLETLLINI